MLSQEKPLNLHPVNTRIETRESASPTFVQERYIRHGIDVFIPSWIKTIGWLTIFAHRVDAPQIVFRSFYV